MSRRGFSLYPGATPPQRPFTPVVRLRRSGLSLPVTPPHPFAAQPLPLYAHPRAVVLLFYIPCVARTEHFSNIEPFEREPIRGPSD